MQCGNGSERTQHPFELFGEDWRSWGSDYVGEPAEPPDSANHEISQGCVANP